MAIRLARAPPPLSCWLLSLSCGLACSSQSRASGVRVWFVILLVLALKLLRASFELRISKRHAELGSCGGLGEAFAKDLVSLDTKAGTVARMR